VGLLLTSARGVTYKCAAPPPATDGMKMVEVGSSRLQNANLAYVLRIFGRPPRTTACDCERAMEPALPQTLFRMSDPTMMAKFTDGSGRAAKLAKTKLTNDELVDELFLAALTRKPSMEEREAAVGHLTGAKTKADGIVDLLWALVNTREFILNH
jgi:hypothetical protein